MRCLRNIAALILSLFCGMIVGFSDAFALGTIALFDYHGKVENNPIYLYPLFLSIILQMLVYRKIDGIKDRIIRFLAAAVIPVLLLLWRAWYLASFGFPLTILFVNHNCSYIVLDIALILYVVDIIAPYILVLMLLVPTLFKKQEHQIRSERSMFRV